MAKGQNAIYSSSAGHILVFFMAVRNLPYLTHSIFVSPQPPPPMYHSSTPTR